MEATPDEYRADIDNTRQHIALIDAGDLLGETPEQAQQRRALLVRQLAGLERSLARVEPLWQQYQDTTARIIGQTPDGRDRLDVGHGCTALAIHGGYAVYGPHGWKAGQRKTLAGARSLAQRTAVQRQAQGGRNALRLE